MLSLLLPLTKKDVSSTGFREQIRDSLLSNYDEWPALFIFHDRSFDSESQYISRTRATMISVPCDISISINSSGQ